MIEYTLDGMLEVLVSGSIGGFIIGFGVFIVALAIHSIFNILSLTWKGGL